MRIRTWSSLRSLVVWDSTILPSLEPLKTVKEGIVAVRVIFSG